MKVSMNWGDTDITRHCRIDGLPADVSIVITAHHVVDESAAVALLDRLLSIMREGLGKLEDVP